MTRLRGLCAFVVLAATLIVPATAGPACASGPHAGLVIDTGNRVLRYCVALPSQSVSGAKLIELAGDQYGLDYHFGSGGGAVCRLAGVGPDGDDCFADYPHYWGYWRGTSSGGWSWSSSGAASTSVSDGDVDGWAWGTGDDGSSHPQPPPSTFASVCASASSHKSAPPRSSAPPPKPAPSPTAAASPPATMQPRPPSPSRRHPAHRRPPHKKHVTSRRRSHANGSVVRLRPSPAAAPTRVPGSGPPVLGLAAVGAVCALAALGGLTARARRASATKR